MLITLNKRWHYQCVCESVLRVHAYMPMLDSPSLMASRLQLTGESWPSVPYTIQPNIWVLSNCSLWKQTQCKLHYSSTTFEMHSIDCKSLRNVVHKHILFFFPFLSIWHLHAPTLFAQAHCLNFQQSNFSFFQNHSNHFRNISQNHCPKQLSVSCLLWNIFIYDFPWKTWVRISISKITMSMQLLQGAL